jgi:putative (di)nucleoside polyphosphate hydrolase
MYRPNISCIIFREKLPHEREYLIVRKPREHNAWQFPQGGVDKGETIEEAARRELKEELNTNKFLLLKKSSHVYFYKFPSGVTRDGCQGHKQMYYWIKFTGEEGNIKLNQEELVEYTWVTEDKLSNYFENEQYIQKIHSVIAECTKKHER